MANKRIRMNKLRDIIRLKASGSSNQSISRQLRLSRTTLIRYLKQVQACGQSYQQLLALPEAALAAIISPVVVHAPNTDASRYGVLSALFEYLEKELKRNGVTRRLLWEEYLKQHPEAINTPSSVTTSISGSKTVRCTCIWSIWPVKSFLSTLPQEALDYRSQQCQVTEVEVLVCVLGASQYTYVEALPSQKKAFLIKGIENALRYFGGVPRAVVPDNLKAAVTRAPAMNPYSTRRLKALLIITEWPSYRQGQQTL
jgi:transposase